MNNGSYGSYGTSYGASTPQTNYGYGIDPSNANSNPNAGLRRRNLDESNETPVTRNKPVNPFKDSSKMVKNLDFMFPKVEAEYTVTTEKGGLASLIAYILVAILCLTEVVSWMSSNGSTIERTSVDTSLGKRMQVNLNITFPALHCEDTHVDVMDVAGDSQFNVEGDMRKTRLDQTGRVLAESEKVESNAHRIWQQQRDKIVNATLPEDYCGPCYGAHETEDHCCNTCDDIIRSYDAKGWSYEDVVSRAEQCIREGRDRPLEPKRMAKGEGCNVYGHFTVNRVNGNFHIAMGEGVERHGRHIHTFVPEDTPNFNASHIIHHLSFGPEPTTTKKSSREDAGLNGVTKIVTEKHGTTGLFQYYIKVVPTTFLPENGREAELDTNRYFFTESFRPLITELDDEHLEDENRAAVHAGHGHGHDHRHVKNSILPGIFFIYEIYPFSVEVRPTSVPFTHLLIRLMATVGGVFTVMRWFDQLLERR